MATIGLINLLMRANSAPFTKDIKKASDSISGLKQEAGSTQSVFSSFSAGFSKAAGAISAVGAAIGAAAIASSLKSLVTESMSSVVATARMSDQLGIATEDLIGLQHAASQSLGADQVEAFTDALSDMQEKIGDVTLEEGGARDIIKILGLDAAKLATQDAVANFAQISDAISKVKSKAEKLHIADTLFGGQGQKLLPLLEQGSAGIEKFSEEAENLGLKFNRVDAAKVEMANAAMGRLSAVIKGTGQQLAIGLAPYIEAAANAFADLGLQGIDVAGYITSGMELVGTAIGIVTDIVHTLGLGWQAAGAVASSAVAGILSVVAEMGDGLASFLNQIPGVEVEFGNLLRDMANDAENFASNSWQEVNKALAAPPPSEGVKRFFDDIRTGADKIATEMANAKKPVDDLASRFTAAALKVGELEDKLKEQIATYGKSSAEVEIYKLAQLGASEEQLAAAKKLSDQLKAKGIVEANMTPLEKYKKELDELQELYNSGAIDKSTFDRAKLKSGKDAGIQELKFASATELGSNEARQAVLRHQGIGSKDPTLGVEKNTAVLVAEAKKQTARLDKIAKAADHEEAFSFN